MNSETWREIYTVNELLIFSWSDTCLAESIGYEGLILFGSVWNKRKF